MSEELDPDIVFKNLEEILNSDNEVIIKKKTKIEVIWLLRVGYYDVIGLLKIDNEMLTFGATLYPEGYLEVKIPLDRILFSFGSETIKKVIERVSSSSKIQ